MPLSAPHHGLAGDLGQSPAARQGRQWRHVLSAVTRSGRGGPVDHHHRPAAAERAGSSAATSSSCELHAESEWKDRRSARPLRGDRRRTRYVETSTRHGIKINGACSSSQGTKGRWPSREPTGSGLLDVRNASPSTSSDVRMQRAGAQNAAPSPKTRASRKRRRRRPADRGGVAP